MVLEKKHLGIHVLFIICLLPQKFSKKYEIQLILQNNAAVNTEAHSYINIMKKMHLLWKKLINFQK
jgi:hypothetical protein